MLNHLYTTATWAEMLLPGLLVLVGIYFVPFPRRALLRALLALLASWAFVPAFEVFVRIPLAGKYFQSLADPARDGTGEGAAVFLLGLTLPVILAPLALGARMFRNGLASSKRRERVED